MENLAEVYLSLCGEDFSVLDAIGSGMRIHEWVPVPVISQLSGLSLRKVEYRLRHLFEKKLVVQETMHYIGYQIDFDAFDVLALSELVKHDHVLSLGDVIGVGKESVVYQAQGEITLAIKFHRQGQTSFKHVRRLRDHLDDQPNLPWIHSASQAARNEFQVMKKLYASVCIPRPIALSHHALAMEFVSGTQLNKITLSDPEVGLNMILAEVGKAWNKGIVHGDLSEFNIMIAEVGPTLIDWPSAVERTNPRAQELLERDVFNILRFFERKYKITMPMETALSKIKLSAGGLP